MQQQFDNQIALFVRDERSGRYVFNAQALKVEPEPKATIRRFDADGSHQTTYASGMHNPTALAFHFVKDRARKLKA